MKPLTLDVGCGHNFQGNVNIDLFTQPTQHRTLGLPNPDTPDFKLQGIPNLIRADCCHLPIRDSVADTTLSSHLIEHIDKPYQLLREMVRVTKPNGVVHIETPHKLSHRRKWYLHKHSFNLSWFAEAFKKLNVTMTESSKDYRCFPHEYFPLFRVPYFIQVTGKVKKMSSPKSKIQKKLEKNAKTLEEWIEDSNDITARKEAVNTLLGEQLVLLDDAIAVFKEMLSTLQQPEFLEKLAELEHDQWCDLINFLLEKGLISLARYEAFNYKQLAKTPYSKLREEQKESDRKFARKVIDLFKEELKELEK